MKRGVVILVTLAAAVAAHVVWAAPWRVGPWGGQRAGEGAADPLLAPPCRGDAVRAPVVLQGALDVLADPPGSLRALAPGKSASVWLWWSNWCGPGSVPTGSPGTPPDGFKLTLASGMGVVVPLTQAPRCDAPQSPSLLSVG